MLKKILVLGQTPPPFGGQAIMIEKLLNIKDKDIELYHVKMSFSSNMAEVGTFKFSKIIHLIKIIVLCYFYKFRFKINILYYPPAGPNLVPILRDFFVLFFVRPIFKYTILHFHAGGISEYLQKKKSPIFNFFKIIYKKPTISIRLSKLNPNDGNYFNTLSDYIIPYGIEDNFLKIKNIYGPRNKFNSNITILYVGVLKYSKGIEILN